MTTPKNSPANDDSSRLAQHTFVIGTAALGAALVMWWRWVVLPGLTATISPGS